MSEANKNGGWGWLWWALFIGGGFWLLGQEPFRERRDYWIARITDGSMAEASSLINRLRSAGSFNKLSFPDLKLPEMEMPKVETPTAEPEPAKPAKRTPAAKPAAKTPDRLTNDDRKALDNLLNDL